MTDEIFRQDGYVFEFEAIVKNVEKDWVELEGTAFYPGGGGQVCDTGSMSGFKVTEVKYNKEGNIIHNVPDHQFAPNDKIWCSVDWDRRYDLMKGHTAEHILFNSLHRQDPEIEIVKIFISPESKYVIVNKDMSLSQISEAVKFANQVVKDNHPVIKSVMSRDDPEIEKVRIKLDRIEEDEITVVEIGDVDIAACSGIHVMETSEIGPIFVDKKISAGKGEYSIHFTIGDEAEKSILNLANTSLQIIDELGSKPEDVVKTVINMKNELNECRTNIKKSIVEILKNIEPEKVGTFNLYSKILYTSDKNPVIEAAERNRSNGDVSVFLCVSQNVSVILCSGNKEVDCKVLMADVMSKFDGRGGGKPEFAQGGISDITKIEEILKFLKETIKRTKQH